MISRHRKPFERARALLLGAAAAALLTQPPQTAAAEHANWLTGNALHQQLERPLGVSWTGAPLGPTLQKLAHHQQVCIVLDRRVDPNRKLDLTVEAEPLSIVLQRVAVQQGEGTAVLDSLVYIGPPVVAERLRTLSALGHEALRKLPPANRRPLQERRAWQWEDLATPRELLANLARQGGVKIEGQEQIPHDLLRSADWPPLAWMDRLLLLAVQFNLGVELEQEGALLRLVPLPEHAEITRSYPAHGQAAALAQKWRGQLPAARINADDDRVLVVARIEDHELLEQAQRGGSAKRTTVKPGKQVYQLAVEKVPVRQLLSELGRKMNLEFELDEPAIRQAGRSLDSLISFKVQDASLDELLAAALAPAGLAYTRQDRKVKVSPAAAQKP